ncbi:MAG: hypothetical protein KGQ26_10525 [Rhodospirillales bacterium]|nr:hypothetical protein [Rhodospirillales bacterium]MDE2318392.1 hypothetical protein [Rhodospirillales bacterium]
MATFFIVYLNQKQGVTDETVEGKMNKALDWYRVDPKTWVLYSTANAEKLYARLEPLAKEGGNVFICELNITNRQGWMPKSFWEWLKKDR